MKIISHRGNLLGPDKLLENNPQHIRQILKDYPSLLVELDIWVLNYDLFLGHDRPEYLIHRNYLFDYLIPNRTYLHLKSLETVSFFSENNLDLRYNCFYHNNDSLVFTSLGEKWCYPGVYIRTGITVMTDDSSPPSRVSGICTDYPLKFLVK